MSSASDGAIVEPLQGMRDWADDRIEWRMQQQAQVLPVGRYDVEWIPDSAFDVRIQTLGAQVEVEWLMSQKRLGDILDDDSHLNYHAVDESEFEGFVGKHPDHILSTAGSGDDLVRAVLQAEEEVEPLQGGLTGTQLLPKTIVPPRIDASSSLGEIMAALAERRVRAAPVPYLSAEGVNLVNVIALSGGKPSKKRISQPENFVEDLFEGAVRYLEKAPRVNVGSLVMRLPLLRARILGFIKGQEPETFRSLDFPTSETVSQITRVIMNEVLRSPEKVTSL